MKTADILVIGGDLRGRYCANYLKEANHNVACYLVPALNTSDKNFDIDKSSGMNKSSDLNLDTFLNTITDYEYLLCPTPFSRDIVNITTACEYTDTQLQISKFINYIYPKQKIIGGQISYQVSVALSEKRINYFDLMSYDSFTYANSYLTAEGLLSDIIKSTPFSLASSNILVLGYGFCGSAIAKMLKLLGANVTIYNRNKYYKQKAKTDGFINLNTLEANDELNNYNIIINTIPSIIMHESHINKLNKDCYIFEVASKPGGFDMESVKKRDLSYLNSPGIPGKLSPQSAAKIICDIIEDEVF